MLWEIIKSKIMDLPTEHRPKNELELKQPAQEIWNSIDMSLINSLIESF